MIIFQSVSTKKRFTIGQTFLSFVMASSLFLAGCGGSSSDNNGGNSSSALSLSSSSSVAVSSSSSEQSSVTSSSTASSAATSSTQSVSSSSVQSVSSAITSSSSSSSSSTNVITQLSQKRGLAYGHHSPDDLAVMQNKVAWWYNWGILPETAVRNNYRDYDFDYVPMIWGASFNENDLRNFLNNNPHVKYLLGFNEPNFAEQANLTPQQAADLWPTLEAIADDYNLKLVGPAVNFSPGHVDIPGTDDDWSPWEYLDAFFAACTGCRVDYIAVHSYMKYPSAFEWFIGEFEKKYSQPIWVTEWAAWDDGGPANVGEQMDFLASTVRWMEANPKVYRYSWFIGRSDGGPTAFPYLDILGGAGQLSPLGGLYTAIPATDYRYAVPVRIEAEGAHRQTGFRHQTTADTSGYVNLLNDGSAWAEYDISVSTAGTYQFDFRLASGTTNRQLNASLNGSALLAINPVHTGGAQAWQTFTAQATLAAGNHTLRIATTTANLGINWLEISQP